jgi:hypothetical protein
MTIDGQIRIRTTADGTAHSVESTAREHRGKLNQRERSKP